MQTQFVTVAGDQEERIVRPCAEDEHRENARDRRIELDADGAGNLSCDDSRECVGQADDDEGDDPQPWTAVGDEQQNGDDDDGGEEKGEVRPVEHGGDVDLEAFRAGEIDANSLQVRRGDVADLLRTRSLLRDVGLRLERNHHEGDRSVVGDLSGRYGAVEGERGKIAECLLIDEGERFLVEHAVFGGEDQQRRGRVGAGELFEQLIDLDGFGGRGQAD